ncbi:hypothetical protein [Parasitella parasitica]|uniref:F-box domain-containing protein n=1 Tax=Parasitella parasitica TaxID=35722 RepID=A0A0B7N6W2_9FUNG|nr:hypothetical protein [Parasitella parasitica]
MDTLPTEILEEIFDRLSGTLEDLVAIFELCPNIETIGCSGNATFERKFLWKSILESNGQHPHLKQFYETDSGWDANGINEYNQLSLRFKNSLTRLILIPQSDEASRDIDYCSLKNEIQKFESLEQLQLYGKYTAASLIGEIDEIMNASHQAVYSVKVERCNLSYDRSYYPKEKENPNNNIKSLEIIDSRLPASTMDYLKNKFASLETLIFNTNATNSCDAQTEEDYAKWWAQMANLCQTPLLNYSISISEFKTQEYIHNIQGSTKLFNTIAPAPTEITLDITNPFDDEDDKMIPLIEMKQNLLRVHLFDSRDSDMFLKNVDFTRLYECLQPFSPSLV